MVTKKPEPQEDTWAEEPKAPVTPVVVQTGEGKITVTLKAGPGFEVPWIVRHANTVAEAVEFMQDEQLDELMDLTARKAKEFAKAFGGSQGFSKPAGSTSTGFSKPAASQPAGAVEWDAEAEEYTCAHGGAVQRKGESAKGPWTGYFCPEPKESNNKCTPKFLNKKR